MDLKNVILRQIKRKEIVRTTDIVKETGFSRAYVHRFLKILQEQGDIVLVGKTKGSFYTLPDSKHLIEQKNFSRVFSNRKELMEDVVLGDIKKERPGIFLGLSFDVADIFDYAFTEILNNAIEHSSSKKIAVNVIRKNRSISFKVIDWGVGVFKSIQRKFKFKNEMEAIEHLLKGKQTSMPERHSGEGLFFTSRAGDTLQIKSFAKKIIFDNLKKDIAIGELSKPVVGTKVLFEIGIDSKSNLKKIFEQYADKNFIFNKTDFRVKVLELTGDSYLSRSEARRLMFGLDKFKLITLDFQKVNMMGQGFADEVFRVWRGRHPNININYINANENVKLMIQRVQANL